MVGKKLRVSKEQLEAYRGIQEEKEFGECIFRTMQLCWWYVIYAPEYGTNWSEERAKEFSNKLNEAYDKLVYKDRAAILQELKDKTGIDCRSEAKSIPYSLMVKIYQKKVNGSDVMRFIFQSRQATEEVFMIVTHVLHYVYGMSSEMIADRYAEFRDFISLYAGGMKASHIEKYFTDVEGIPIID